MTVLEQPGSSRNKSGLAGPPPAWRPRVDPAPLLPDAEPYRLLGTDAARQDRLRTADPAVRPAGARPPVQRPGHGPDPAGPPGGLPVLHRTGGLRGRRRAGPRRPGLALPQLSRHPRRRGPRPRPRTGADPAARRLAQRIRPARAPHRPAVHPARHPAPACRGPGARRPPQGRRRGGAGDGRRRRHERGRLPRGAELRGGLAGTGGLPRPEQRLRDLRAAGQADRRALPRPQGGRIRHAGPTGRRQ